MKRDAIPCQRYLSPLESPGIFFPKVKRLSAAVASKPGQRLLNLRTSHSSNDLVEKSNLGGFGLPKGGIESMELF